ncbi:DUF4351 domain-containing protein [Salicola sp. Rm-C-2C1-2]|uniref:DUF4351 domain-containing protein n=1 Tax=Salicola sp. Rm-C-2C1-2 TaxID=3141321 RepID=UPI0032E4CDE3
MDHDQNFKNLILDYRQDALTFFAADEAEAIDETVTVRPVREQQLKQRLGDRFRELDVPLMATWPDGRREALLFAIEEETQPSRFSIHRLAHYCLDVAELEQVDRIVPVVIFLRAGRDMPRTLTLGSEYRTYLNFRYIPCELARLRAEDYFDSTNPVARINLPNMQWPQEQKIEMYAHAIRGLLELDSDPNRRAKYIDFIDSYTELTDNERIEYDQRFPQESNVMTGIVGRARDEGIQKGLSQGQTEGERALLTRLLKRRFGELDPETQQRLDEASTDELERWGENVLEAQTLEEVFTRH